MKPMKKLVKYVFFTAVTVIFSACIGQGVLPPLPQDALTIDASLEIKSFNDNTGDVTLKYVLYFENVSDETLEKLILKDFQLPQEIVMKKDYFEITNLAPGEEKSVKFEVVVKGWGLNPKDQEWEVYFTVRLEKGSAYTESDAFYYVIHLYP